MDLGVILSLNTNREFANYCDQIEIHYLPVNKKHPSYKCYVRNCHSRIKYKHRIHPNIFCCPNHIYNLDFVKLTIKKCFELNCYYRGILIFNKKCYCQFHFHQKLGESQLNFFM